MECLGNPLESIFSMPTLFQILQSTYLLFSAKLHVLLRNKEKRESKTRCSWLVFFPHHPPSFSPSKSMYELSFHPLLAFILDFSNSWASKWIWKLLYASMGVLIRFSKPTFWLFRMASLCIWISHVIIYCSLLLHKVGYCTLIQYRLVLCWNFSLLCW